MNAKYRLPRLAAACAALLALAAATASAGGRPGDPLDPRTYAPASERLLVVYATGVQRYTCQADGTWLFTDPVATLSKMKRAEKAVGTHFLNPVTGRPVWQLADGSSVEAARTASASAGPESIPLLLLQTTATSADGSLASTTWVQRLNTSGGIAPAGACVAGDHVAVPYRADYVFWQASD